MRKAAKKSVLITGLVCLALLLFQNCGMHISGGNGTETGNAMSPDIPQPTTARPAFAVELVAHLCSRAVACQVALSQGDCQTQLLSVPGLPQAFGVANNIGISTMQGLQVAETQGLVHAVSANVLSCENQIAQISCADVAAAVSAGATAGSLPAMVDARASVCAQVYPAQ